LLITQLISTCSDIMAYFTGAPDGSGVAHDDEAKTIAQNAWEFTERRMRWEDMQSYTLLLALEVNSPHPFSRTRQSETNVRSSMTVVE
jgi:hypothetical protein